MIKNFYHPELLQTPDGVRDIYGRECELKNHIQDKIHSIIKSYGFDDIQTPSFEFFDIFNKERGTVKSNEMYKFVDRNNNTLVLRPDITPSIARSVSKYYENEKLQVRLCYVGNTYINNSNYQGRLKEVTQAGAELINDDTSDADAEMIALTVEALLEAGITEFRIDVGHVGFFNGLVEEAGLDNEQINELKELLERKNLFAVEQFVAGLPINDSVKKMLIKLPEMFGSDEYLEYAKKNVNNECSLAAVDRLEKLYSIIDVYGMRQYVNFDLGMLSNYNYYTGTIFKAYTYGLGEPIATGGRYDRLLKQFGKDGAAIGVAINVDQLMLAIERKKLHPEPENNSCIILYSSTERKKAIELAAQKRKDGINVRLMRKKRDVSVEEYRAYADNNRIKEFLYIESGGESGREING